jgi:hypothetical protein
VVPLTPSMKKGISTKKVVDTLQQCATMAM